MAVVQLASESDVVAAMGRALTSEESAKVGAILDKASELFRLRSGQQFTAGTSDVLLRVTADRIVLPQRPVVSVESVQYDRLAVDPILVYPIQFELYKSRLTVYYVRSGELVRVKYTHGGEVPDLVRLTVAEVAKKVLSISKKAQAGMVQSSSTEGPFSDSATYATWAQGGQTMLAPDDAVTAESFRVKTYAPILQTAGPSWRR